MKQASQRRSRIRASQQRISRAASSLIEGLEQRALFSGNVQATVVDGRLVLKGDAAANVIQLDQVGLTRNQVRISNTDTRINRHSRSLVLSGITDGVALGMGVGADSVVLTGLNLGGDLSVAATGAAAITLTGVTVSQSLRMRVDASATTLTDVHTGHDLKVAGAQDVTLSNVRVDRDLEMLGTGTADALTIDDSTFRGFTRLESGRGGDVTKLDSSGDASGDITRFSGPARIAMGDGTDLLQLGIVGEGGNRTVFGGRTYFDGGKGGDTLSHVDAGTYLRTSQSITKSFEINIPIADVIAPTITGLSPTDLKTNVAINKTIAATFNESIDQNTLAGNFTLTGPGNSTVAGVLNFDPVTRIATFNPDANLTANTLFTATLVGGVNGVKDQAGNALAADGVWTFTTGTQIAQDPIDLGDAADFAVMATASITSTGTTDVTGDVGLNPGTSQGIPTAQVHGGIHVNDPAAISARADLLSAYNDAVSRTITSIALAGNMGGITYTPGLYTNLGSVLISGSGPNNIVTLDAQGDPNAVFIFKMSTTLTTAPGAQVVLAGGAKAANVFWQVGSSATLDTTTTFKGSILASVTITVNAGSNIEGRLLAGSNSDGSVTLNSTTITVPTD